MTFVLELKCDSAAFTADAGAEIARILEEIAREIRRDGVYTGPAHVESWVYDAHGEPVGTVKEGRFE